MEEIIGYFNSAFDYVMADDIWNPLKKVVSFNHGFNNEDNFFELTILTKEYATISELYYYYEHESSETSITLDTLRTPELFQRLSLSKILVVILCRMAKIANVKVTSMAWNVIAAHIFCPLGFVIVDEGKTCDDYLNIGPQANSNALTIYTNLALEHGTLKDPFISSTITKEISENIGLKFKEISRVDGILNYLIFKIEKDPLVMETRRVLNEERKSDKYRFSIRLEKHPETQTPETSIALLRSSDSVLEIPFKVKEDNTMKIIRELDDENFTGVSLYKVLLCVLCNLCIEKGLDLYIYHPVNPEPPDSPVPSLSSQEASLAEMGFTRDRSIRPKPFVSQSNSELGLGGLGDDIAMVFYSEGKNPFTSLNLDLSLLTLPGVSSSESEELKEEFRELKDEIAYLVHTLPLEYQLKLSLVGPLELSQSDQADTARAMNKLISELCIRARKTARSGNVPFETGAVADQVSRIAYDGLIEHSNPDEPRSSSTSGNITRENEYAVSGWRDTIARKLITVNQRDSRLSELLAKSDGEQANSRRTQLRRMLGAITLRVLDEETETEMFHAWSCTVPVDVETSHRGAGGSAVVKYDLHRFTDSPGTDYQAVIDVIRIKGFGFFADNRTSFRVLQSLLSSPRNPNAFGYRVCTSMADSINDVIKGAPPFNRPASIQKYSTILSGESMGCLLLGRMAPSLDKGSATFHFRNPLLLNHELDIPKGVQTFIAYADSADNVVGASRIRRPRSEMHRVCLNREEVVMLPLKGKPCKGGRPSILKAVLGSNHDCMVKLLESNIEAENENSSGGGAPHDLEAEVCLALPDDMILSEEDLASLGADMSDEDDDIPSGAVGGSPGPNNSFSLAAAALLMLAVTVSASIAGAR